MSEVNPFEVTNGGMYIKEMDFRKKVSIPDVNERTNNDPVYLMSSNDVLKLIKSMYPDGARLNDREEPERLSYAESGKEVITTFMLTPIITSAINNFGWSEVKPIGKQLLFIK